jgi:ABC-2 type transport system permease protein
MRQGLKLLAIFRFELGYQVRRAWTWLIFAALVVFAFLFTRDGSLSDVLRDDFFLNSPFLVAGATVFGCVIWLLIAAAVAGDAAARDVATGMHPFTYTAPVSKTDYLGGRLLAAFVLNALILLAIPAGNLLGSYLPGVHPDAVGPFRLAAYVTAYAFIALPNAFVATAIQFSLASPSGRPMAGYVGSLLLVFMAFFVASFLLFRSSLGTLLDPIGMRFVVEDLSRLWTPIEKRTRLIELEGAVLTNRFLWIGVGVGALALTYARFRFAHRAESRWWGPMARFRAGRFGGQAQSPMPAGSGVTASVPVSVPQVPRTSGFVLNARQTLAIAWTSFRTIATSWTGLALLAAIPLLTVLVVLDQMESGGVPLIPTTALVIAELTAPLSAELSRWLIVPLLIVYFAGELVWRERDAGLGEITDAMPGSEWAPFIGRFLGLGLLLVVFMTLLTTAGMLAQVLLGYRDFEIGLYLKILFGLQLPEYLLFALLALVLHVLADQKYIGHLVAIIAYAFIALASMFGIEHNLLVYGAGPGWSYTEMRGFGASLAPWLWFESYWAAWALLLAVAARLLWVRGRERGLSVRLQLARRRLTRPTVWTAATAMGLVLALGGFIFYNTNVLNAYFTAFDRVGRSAEYERRYGRYAGIPQPRVTATTLRVEIYPERRAVDIRGTYRLVNRSAAAIESIHVAIASDVETGDVKFDRPAARVLADETAGHRIYALTRPLEPGDSLQLDFEVHVEPHGFRESGIDGSVAANGTYFTDAWLPAIGYARGRELTSASDRREHGLAPRSLIPSLYDVEARKDRGEGIAFEAVVGTDEGQLAVAPGRLRRTWTEGGRRYFDYSTDGPIGDEWAFFSARYAVREARWNDVAIRIFHDPRHTRNLERMVRSIRASLDYYTAQFGPYPRAWLSVVERPGNGTGMHADAGMLTFTEGAALWNPKDDPGSLDLPYAVVAHEMAHQWTVPYAGVEGAPVMSESLAWYYAMKAVEHARGPEQLRRLLTFMRQPHPYPPIRRGEPLLRGLDPYLAYRRGPFALYALSEYIGEERVNGALRRLLEKHRPDEAPLATTLDLYRELRAVTPDALQYLLHDLFEVNTRWELETERASARPAQAGTWQVTLDVRARKVVADSAGVETELPMDEWVEIGVFDDKGLNEPIYLQTHRISAGRQTITVTAPGRPARAGIDPRHLLIDWETDDNVQDTPLNVQPGAPHSP